MPRIVDHAARRRDLVAALWRVVRDHGVEGATVRAVAAESGHSAGSLRHYFSTQGELFTFALQAMLEQVTVRVQGVLEAEREPRSRARLLVEQLLPLDEVRTVEVLVWLAFADRARHDATLDQVRRDGWHGTANVARQAVAALNAATPPASLEAPLSDPRLEHHARRLQLLVDGWCLQAISYPDLVPAQRLRDELDAVLDEMTTG